MQQQATESQSPPVDDAGLSVDHAGLSVIHAGLSVDVVFLPAWLLPGQTYGKTVVVFDVLRATTTITSALSTGVREIRVFDTLVAARDAALGFPGHRLLCGEQNAIRPDGFDYGNSPGQFDPTRDAGATVFLATTNGTAALLAARDASLIVAGALVNARAAARQALVAGLPILLLCSGTSGAVSMEDLVGCGAVLAELQQLAPTPRLASDSARIALNLFDHARADLPAFLRTTTGGQNVRHARLTPDIDFAARLNVFDFAATFDPATGTVRR